MPILQVLRTPKGGAVGADYFPGHGTILRPVDDPDGVALDPELFTAIRLDPNFQKIPASLANRISDLYVTMLGRQKEAGFTFNLTDSQKEVSVVLLRDEETQTKWRVLVPTQVVGGASVEADYTKPLCDIETGEKVEQFPPPGWLHAGSSHSHNTMGAFFSSVDDKNELPMPGVHFVLGGFRQSTDEGVSWNFDVAASIVYHHRRFERVIEQGPDGQRVFRKLVWQDILEFTLDTKYEAHANVHQYISVEKPQITVVGGGHSGYARDYALEGYYGRSLLGFTESDDHRRRPIDVRNKELVSRVRSKVQHIKRANLDDRNSVIDWLTAFDSMMSSFGIGLVHRAFDDAVSPNEVITKRGIVLVPKDLNDKGRPRMELPARSTTGYWCPRQSHVGTMLLEVGLFFLVESGSDVVPYIQVGYGGSGATMWREAKAVFAAQLADEARAQRAALGIKEIVRLDGAAIQREIDFDERDEALIAQLDAEFDDWDEGDEEFATRGVKASDFTKTEVDLLIRSWSRDKILGPFLRESINTHIFGNGGTRK